MRIACVADTHIGPGRTRVDPETGLNSALLDRARVFKWCVGDAIERGAQVILHAGDFFHSCKPSPTEARLVRDALQPAYDAAVPVVGLVGNHDAPRNGSELHALDLLLDMDGLMIVDRPCLLDVYEHSGDYAVGLADAEERYGAATALQIAALPWPQTSRLLTDEEVRGLEPAQRNLLIREKLMDCLRGLASQRLPDVPCLLLAHAGIDTATMGATNTLAMLGSDWTLNLYEVAALDFSAAFFGHYHKPQDLLHGPYIGYVGSPEAVSAGEEDEGKSYTILDLDFQGLLTRERIASPYRRFVTLDWEDFTTEDPPAEVRDAIVRLRVPESCADVLPNVRARLEAAGAHEITVEIIRPETQRRRETSISGATPPAEALSEHVKQHPELAEMEPELQGELAAVEGQRGGVQ